MDPLPGVIPVAVNGAILLLTQAEYLIGIRPSRWWRRSEAMQEREATFAPSPVVASG